MSYDIFPLKRQLDKEIYKKDFYRNAKRLRFNLFNLKLLSELFHCKLVLVFAKSKIPLYNIKKLYFKNFLKDICKKNKR